MNDTAKELCLESNKRQNGPPFNDTLSIQYLVCNHFCLQIKFCSSLSNYFTTATTIIAVG